MPAAIAHFLHAQRVLELLQKQQTKPELNKDAFLWGAQGPDFLYCHRYFPWQRGISLREFAEKLHLEEPSKTLAFMREYLALQPQTAATLSYIYGFLCHYSLDRLSHPFIRYGTLALYKQNPEQDEDILHNQIESALDVIMLRYERSALPAEFNLKQTVPKNGEVQSAIADLYAFLLYGLFGTADAGIPLLQATNDCRTVFGLLNDRTTMKKAIAERLEKRGKRTISCHFRGISEDGEYDYANILHADWRWSAHSTVHRKESFFDLYEKSVEDSMNLIDGFLEAGDCKKLTGNILFI